MAERRDRPPVLRVLILLSALVGTALALAALSPAAPEGAGAAAAPAGSPGTDLVTVPDPVSLRPSPG
ncbi:MAG TPA: hypothetical protein PKJ45_04360 [Rubrivivax sp.]|nr:hypothetical protein [Rubrivivax sp.]